MWLKAGPKRKPTRIQLAARRYFAVSKKFACNILYDRGASEARPVAEAAFQCWWAGFVGWRFFKKKKKKKKVPKVPLAHPGHGN